ncbi:MAG: LysR family transcriptional regulator [Planctomycetota bacterium]
MELRQLRAFLALADELHFGRAARRLGTTQPAVSRMLRELEEELGARLLNRTSRSTSLTPAGKAFQGPARKCLDHSEMAQRAARERVSDGIQRLRIGVAMGGSQPALGEALRLFNEAHPAAEISTTAIDEASLAYDVTSGSVDVAIAWDGSIPKGLKSRHFMAVPMSVLVSRNHRLARKSMVSLRDLAEERIIMPRRDRNPVILATYQSYTAEFGFKPRVIADVSGMDMLLALVAGGVGVGNAPITPGLRYPGVKRIKQEPRFELKYRAVWYEKTYAIGALLDCLESASPSRCE